jgi:hypothetical protein
MMTGDSLNDEVESSDIDYLSDLSSPEFSKHARQSQPSINKWVDVHQHHESKERAPTTVPSAISGTKHLSGNLETLRKVLRNLSNDQRSSEKAYDDHADWLQSLKREVTEFQSSKENYAFSS